MSIERGARAARVAVLLSLAAAALPPSIAAQGQRVHAEVGAHADVVRLRHFPGGPRFVYFEGSGAGAFGGVRMGSVGVEATYARGRVRREDGPGDLRDLWIASGRVSAQVVPWLRLQFGPDAWRVDESPALELVAWMVGGAVEFPLVRELVVGKGAFATSIVGDAGSLGSLDGGAVAEIGLTMDPSIPLAVSAVYRISRHSLELEGGGSHRLEELVLTLGFRLR